MSRTLEQVRAEAASATEAKTEATARTGRAVVVGIDGSNSSRAALRWAARQARLSNAPLVGITTWDWSKTYGAAVPWPADIDFEADARGILEQCVDEALGADRRGEVTPRVVHGPPAHALEEASRHASLLVVGCRGHGELAGMVLGSVSEFLATHAHCPVVIVRGEEKDVIEPSGSPRHAEAPR